MNAVKGTFEYQGRTWKTYWNGKEYGKGTCYVTATSPTGSEVKITFSPETGTRVGGASSLDFAYTALRSLDVAPFNKYDFSY